VIHTMLSVGLGCTPGAPTMTHSFALGA
jgi:hypothetical protein